MFFLLLPLFGLVVRRMGHSEVVKSCARQGAGGRYMDGDTLCRGAAFFCACAGSLLSPVRFRPCIVEIWNVESDLGSGMF